MKEVRQTIVCRLSEEIYLVTTEITVTPARRVITLSDFNSTSLCQRHIDIFIHESLDHYAEVQRYR